MHIPEKLFASFNVKGPLLDVENFIQLGSPMPN
jgi:hypothetical protein